MTAEPLDPKFSDRLQTELDDRASGQDRSVCGTVELCRLILELPGSVRSPQRDVNEQRRRGTLLVLAMANHGAVEL
jgi:hypothetical protein